MPYLINRPKIRRFVTALVSASAVVMAVPAVAAACTLGDSNTTKAFKSFGDSANYAPASGGTFENGATGWTLDGASIVSGNESYFVDASGDSHALNILPSATSVISAPICVSTATPTFRLFDRLTSGSWGEVNINVLWTDSSGVTHITTAGGPSASTRWQPTPIYKLGQMLPLGQPDSTLSVRLQFVPAHSGGAIAIDDIEVDPYSR